MYQLLYCNRAARRLYSSGIMSLLESAQPNNETAGVTGMLCFTGEHFVQFLEGEAGAVLSIMARVRSDARHTDIDVRFRRPCEARSFSRWSMGYAPLTPSAHETGSSHMEKLTRQSLPMASTEDAASDRSCDGATNRIRRSS